ncbi:MAG: GNAT family N-acetyltransferase [Isosphaeraceae bacterium]|nr:GNAT family N-acetyltransferase [Isosphaeraceae bacterium]
MPGSPFEILPCPPEARAAALDLLYRRADEPLRGHLVAAARDAAQRGGLDLSGLWIARRRGRVAGALLTQVLAGRTAAVWPPEVEPSWQRAAMAQALLRAALEDLRTRGARIAQALLDPSSPRHAAADLTRAGMPRVTHLIYLRRETSPPLPLPTSVPRLHWRSYSPETDAEFRAILQATYHDSLDMPELEGVRSLDDILAGHRAGGRFDPGRWWIGRIPEEPDAAAIVLLSASHNRAAWEVAYLGLTPPARGRGLGRATLAYALDLARPHTPRLELAVDARNRPAEQLYRSAGFLPFDRRAVYLKVLRGC